MTDTGPLTGARVLVVASYDSFLKSASRYAAMLERHGAQVDYVLALARPRQISQSQQQALGFDERVPIRTADQVATREFLEPYDICLLSLDGQRTRHFTALFYERFADAPKRPLTLSFYPGLVFRFHLEGFCSRATSDLVLLNSPHDVELYDQMLRGAGIERSNAICAGLVMLPSLQGVSTHPPSRPGAVTFMGQPTVPSARVERQYVVDQLIRLARRHPTQRFLLKPRHRPGETTLHQTRYHYQDLLAERPDAPPNLQITYEGIKAVLDDTKLCLTFSSTAAAEAMVHGIRTRILTDVGIHENVGNHFFLGSGLLTDLADVEPDMEAAIDQGWLQRHIRSATDAEAEICAHLDVLLRTQRERGAALPPPHDRLFLRAPAFTQFVRQAGDAPLWQFGEPSGWAAQKARMGAIAMRLWGLATRHLPAQPLHRKRSDR